jgi:hypothetical protein
MMNRTRSAFVTVAVIALFLPGTGARGTTSDPGPGFLCGFSSVTDPNTEGGTTQVGEVDGGPLTLVDDSGAPGSGTLVCTIQVGESTHVGTDQAGASAHGTGVVTLAPTLISYESPTGVPVFLCTSYIDDDGVTVLYWNDSNDPTISGSWSTDPNAACGLAIEAGDGGGGGGSQPEAGFLCAFASVSDPSAVGSTQVGELSGGPLVLVDGSGSVGGSGTLVCTIQVGEGTHAGTDAATAAGFGTGVVTVAPSLVSYEAPTDAVYLCTRFVDGETVLYWNDSNNPTVSGSWTTDPNASCGLSLEAGANNSTTSDASMCPVLLTIDSNLGTQLAGTWGGCGPYSAISEDDGDGSGHAGGCAGWQRAAWVCV